VLLLLLLLAAAAACSDGDVLIPACFGCRQRATLH